MNKLFFVLGMVVAFPSDSALKESASTITRAAATVKRVAASRLFSSDLHEIWKGSEWNLRLEGMVPTIKGLSSLYDDGQGPLIPEEARLISPEVTEIDGRGILSWEVYEGANQLLLKENPLDISAALIEGRGVEGSQQDVSIVFGNKAWKMRGGVATLYIPNTSLMHVIIPSEISSMVLCMHYWGKHLTLTEQEIAEMEVSKL